MRSLEKLISYHSNFMFRNLIYGLSDALSGNAERQKEAQGHVTVHSDFVEEESGTFIAEFDDFILQRGLEDCALSPKINIGDTQWAIYLQKKKFDDFENEEDEVEDDDDDDDPEVYLSCSLENQGSTNVTCSFKFSILGKLGQIIKISSTVAKRCMEPGDAYGFPYLISQADLHSEPGGLLVDKKLTIKVDLTIYRMVFSRPDVDTPSPPVSTLAGGLQSLFQQETYPPDIAITAPCSSADESTPLRTKRKRAAKGDFTTASISAHKAILVARSPVFAAMFTGCMQEATSAEVFVPDFSDQVMHAFVQFLYSDSCSLTVLCQHAEQLLEAACKYQVPALQTRCVNFLKARLNASNAVRVLALADLHGLLELRERALNWVTRNLKSAVQSADFRGQLLSAELCHELLQRLSQTA